MGDTSKLLSRRRFLHLSGSATLVGMIDSHPLLSAQRVKAKRPNILFVIVDDMRPDLGCYGNSVIKTPHIDSVAARGVVFQHAYCQQAMCNPSRASVLTGKRPDTIGVWDQSTHIRKNQKNIVTLPQYFKKKGYKSVGIGKVFHPQLEDPPSWSVEKPQLKNKNIYVSPDTLSRQTARVFAAKALGKSDSWINTIMRGPAVESCDAPDSDYLDGAVTEAALKKLKGFSGKYPFFLAVGYYKPHLPFVAPKKYWDLYKTDEIPLATNNFPPKDAPPFAINDMFELACYEGYAQIPKATEGALPEAKARILKHGYYACVSFIDAQIGRLLTELDRLRLRENTIVVIWGDHGWKLGEHRSWCKQTNYEIDTRSPLIISSPQAQAQGRSSPGLVELVDLYPSLCELAG
ncbi:MAG: sulfatase, partial [Candidatus Aminicenantes bacterium]|nr:sulfatase [Candidatus Aminicenantes bacterium]